MSNYKSQQRKENSVFNSMQIEYSPSLLEKSLGFVRVFGLTSIPEGVRNILDYAKKRGDITQEQIESAQSRYHQEYEKNPFERLFH